MEPTQKYRVFLITLGSSTLFFTLGVILGWTSPILPKLREHTSDSPLEATVNVSDEGWIGSLVPIGAVIASFFTGMLSDSIGRKYTLLLSSLLCVASFILFIYGFEVWIICLGRLIQGVGGGIASSTLQIYVGEISPDEYRGALGTMLTCVLNAGILYIYAIGPYVSFNGIQWCCMVFPAIACAVFAVVPESPYYLAAKGRKVDGIKALKFIRGQSMEAAKTEMNHIQKEVDESMSNKGTIFDILQNRGYRRALIISCGLLTFQVFSGTNAITFNSQTIFMSTGSQIDPAFASILLGTVQLVANLFTSFFVDRLGRKIILLISAVGACVSLFALGFFFYVKEFGDVSNFLWMPIPALVLFFAMFSFGMGSIPWTVLGEIFPPNIKSTASSIATVNTWTLAFVVTRWYPELDALGSYYAFWIFGSLTVVAILFISFVMIETKGLSLQEIQDKLHSSKKSTRNGTIYEGVKTNVTEKV